MEMNKYCLVVWIFLFANAVYCRTALAVDEEVYDDAPKSEAQSYFDLIPEEDREFMIRYHLADALQNRGTYVTVSPSISRYEAELEFGEPPNAFSMNLLGWVKATFQLTDRDVTELVETSSVCLPTKGCLDPSDIGNHCCPF